ncbi:hypothetical protein GQ54DRAFT_200028 [Martensiomyces pterosporus]|nr:hypothetical protein GQ54DRAFT_200028 [Martensiomyces pterosporus]
MRCSSVHANPTWASWPACTWQISPCLAPLVLSTRILPLGSRALPEAGSWACCIGRLVCGEYAPSAHTHTHTSAIFRNKAAHRGRLYTAMWWQRCRDFVCCLQFPAQVQRSTGHGGSRRHAECYCGRRCCWRFSTSRRHWRVWTPRICIRSSTLASRAF